MIPNFTIKLRLLDLAFQAGLITFFITFAITLWEAWQQHYNLTVGHVLLFALFGTAVAVLRRFSHNLNLEFIIEWRNEE